MLYAHMEPTLLHISGKTQPTTTSISNVIAKYVSETNMPTVYMPYVLALDMHVRRKYALNIPHMESLATTVQKGVRYTYLT